MDAAAEREETKTAELIEHPAEIESISLKDLARGGRKSSRSVPTRDTDASATETIDAGK